MKHLIAIIFLIASCRPFKGGNFYNGNASQMSVIHYYFYPNGNYEQYFLHEGNVKKLNEKGKWISYGRKIIICVDSSFNNGTIKLIEDKRKSVFKKRYLSSELIMKNKLNGIKYVTILRLR